MTDPLLQISQDIGEISGKLSGIETTLAGQHEINEKLFDLQRSTATRVDRAEGMIRLIKWIGGTGIGTAILTALGLRS